LKAAVLLEPRHISVIDAKKPQLGPDQVLVAVRAVGICGSDIHMFKEGKLGSVVLKEPFVLGHECTGQVLETGAQATGVEPGDRVIVEPGVPCRRCEFCKRGEYNLCPEVAFIGIPPTSGALAEYITVASDFVYRLPDQVGFAEGTALEPLSVGIQATEEGGVALGSTVVILGVGSAGLMALQTAKLRGASAIFAVDVLSGRLDAAVRLGATEAIDPRERDPVAVVGRLTAGRGVDVVVETAGSSVTVRQGLDLVRRGGSIVLVGTGMGDVPLDITRVVRSGLKLTGMFRYRSTFPLAVELVRKSKIDLKSVVTHTFPFAQVQEAFSFADEHKDVSIKCVVELP
jgi:L-iditol 2-dehydrogenase